MLYVMGELSPGDSVTIDCTERGEPVIAPYSDTDANGTTCTLWDHIISPYDGYVSDGFVNTGTSNPVAPTCG